MPSDKCGHPMHDNDCDCGHPIMCAECGTSAPGDCFHRQANGEWLCATCGKPTCNHSRLEF